MPGLASSSKRITTTVRADHKSGKLVRTATVQRPPVTLESREAIDHLIDTIADQQGVEKHLVHSVIKAESNYEPGAVSRVGAQGIMQLIPSTARRFGVLNSFDPRQNIEGGVRYLRYLLNYYGGDYTRTIAAYNAGENAVDKYHGVPPYAETKNYVYKVIQNLLARRAEQTVTPLQIAAPAVPVPPVTPAVSGPPVLPVPPPLPISTLQLATSITTLPIRMLFGTDGRVYYKTP